MAWKNKYIYAEEIAVVIPIPQNVLDDSDYDIIGEAKPRIIEQFYKKIDNAIITGAGKPATWPAGLVESVINYGNNVAYSADDNTYTQISKAMGAVEADGFDVTGLLGGIGLKASFRTGLLDSTGQPLANSEVTELPRSFVKNGAWNDNITKFIVGDFKQAVYAIRSDIEFKLFDTGVVTDGSGNILYNLMQQDMLALRVTMRLGWALPNPVNVTNSDNATRLPFAFVEPSSSATTYNVTFTVTDSSSSAVANAVVTMGGQVKKTNSSGQAVFKSLGNGSYLYKVEKSGVTRYGETTVETSAVTVTVADFNSPNGWNANRYFGRRDYLR